MTTQKGFINRFDKQKGFGFLTTVDGEDCFFHYKDMMHSILAVEFDVEETPKGLKAINVRKRSKE